MKVKVMTAQGNRRNFYDRLLADYGEHPRTVLLSTHLIDEVADLLEYVVMIDHGRIVIDAGDVRGHAGPIAQVTTTAMASRRTSTKFSRRRMPVR
ncbi:MAG TPA: hypothetical protein VIJ09_06695 [Acidimicrobiales bacterium]